MYLSKAKVSNGDNNGAVVYDLDPVQDPQQPSKEPAKTPNNPPDNNYLPKIDARILPLAIVLHVCVYLDESDFGLMQLSGLTKLLGFSEADLAKAASIFSVFYASFEGKLN
ncbi:hypothetical protein AYI70_g3007 [Smittium culicis]|uniref:Uncharacterized protein n=1 Tax=Smittium culicis TaxID=133412 RepID=A0A1R1Y5K5_9FUNG|nr:hypothetical protein AYI70_g3007 [Smittium culicis]